MGSTSLLGVAAFTALLGTATVGILTARELRPSTAATVGLLAGSILVVIGAVVFYRRIVQASEVPAESWAEQRRKLREAPVPSWELWLGYGFIGLICTALVYEGGPAAVWLFPTQEWAYKWQYFDEPNLEGATFEVEPKPHGCEFLTAPIGAKHCHYEAIVMTRRVGRSQAGERIVSYDEGKTWRPATPSDEPWLFVTWDRVED